MRSVTRQTPTPSMADWIDGPLPRLELEQAACDLFAESHPRGLWSAPEMQDECDRARRSVLRISRGLAASWSIPSGQGINESWRQAFAATQIANVLAELAAGVPFTSLDVADRAWVRGQSEQLVSDAVDRFCSHPGDPEYRPEQEPEYDAEVRS